MNQQPQTVIIQQSSNGLGTAGLVFSILGWFTCGLLCIPGAALSFLGMFSRGPKGSALAGLLVGFPGVLFFIFVGMGSILGMLGIGSAASTAAARLQRAADQAAATRSQQASIIEDDAVPPIDETQEAISETIPPIDETNPAVNETKASVDETTVLAEETRLSQTEPIDPINEEAPQPDSEPIKQPVGDPTDVVRTFTDASGKFSIKATAVAVKQGFVRLKRADSGAEISVQIEKLSPADQTWIRENFLR